MPAHPSFYLKRSVYQEVGDYSLSYKIAADFDMMVRLFYKRGLNAKYIEKDFVTMRTGGMSTAGLGSRTQIMHDHLRAMKQNGVYSNVFLLSLRYFYKIYELLRGGHHTVK